jgi:hypothetical protein
VESVDVQISLLWWIQGLLSLSFNRVMLRVEDVTNDLLCWGMKGNGWLKEVRGNGVRGYIDRRHLRFPENWVPPKRKWKRGSLHLTKFHL